MNYRDLEDGSLQIISDAVLADFTEAMKCEPVDVDRITRLANEARKARAEMRRRNKKHD